MQARKFDFGRLLFGAAFILMAFWAGGQSSATLGLIGFLPFFYAGVMLVAAAFRRAAPSGEGEEKK